MAAKKKRSEKKPEQEAGGSSPGRSFWSGTITFGLVSIPVDFYAATRSSPSRLRMVTEEGHPVGRRYVCPLDEQPIEADEIVRGFQVESGQFVVVTDEELEGVAPEKTRDIELRRFVNKSELPRLLMVRPYVLAPSGSSAKAYRLLAETMEQSEKVGIATFVMRDKAYVVAILAEGGVLRAETLRFSDELRTPQSIGLPEAARASAAQVKPFLAAIDELRSDELDLADLHDDYAQELEKLAQKKLKQGKDVVRATEEAEGENETFAAPIDLVALLKQRLEKDGAVNDTQVGPKKKRTPQASTGEDLNEAAKSELYERAKSLGIEGRSKMTKKDLVQAIRRAAG